jgi:hypothetical protein
LLGLWRNALSLASPNAAAYASCSVLRAWYAAEWITKRKKKQWFSVNLCYPMGIFFQLTLFPKALRNYFKNHCIPCGFD